MTKSQQAVLNNFKKDILLRDGLGVQHVDNYEYKQWNVVQCDFGIVELYSVVGRKQDEGTMAQLYARTCRHYFIGKRGSVTCYIYDLKTDKTTVIKGYSNCLIKGFRY